MTMARYARAVAWCALLLIAVAIGRGCAASALLYNIAPPKVAPAFILADRPTLILVDDPAGAFGDPQTPNTLAARIAIELKIKDSEALETAPIIPIQKLNDLESRLGQDFDKTPVDEVARQLGAEQVIHVTVLSATWMPEAGLWRPTGKARVKVIKADGTRVFPPDSIETGDLGSSKLGEVTTLLQPRASTSVEPKDVPAIRSTLIDRLGRDVGRLFHEWTVDRDPGAKFRD